MKIDGLASCWLWHNEYIITFSLSRKAPFGGT